MRNDRSKRGKNSVVSGGVGQEGKKVELQILFTVGREANGHFVEFAKVAIH